MREIAITKGQIADILFSRGELDAAVRTYREVLTLFERLGDQAHVARAKSAIADVLVQRGELDEALRIRTQEELPLAQRMDDIESVAHIRLSCAQIRLRRGDHEKGDIQTIFDELSEAFQISLKLQRPDFIGTAGTLLGQILALGGHSNEAVEVIETAAVALEKIGQADNAAHCRRLIAQIKGTGS